MHVLVIKTSSLGDVIHTLPALTDAARAIPGIRFDWVVEEAFAEIPSWHPAVETVIPVAIRRWRKSLFSLSADPTYRDFRERLATRHYDAVIDAQGLLKSAWICRLAQGPSFGLDKHSAREGLASWFYRNRLSVARGQHAVERVRQLFAAALEYPLPGTLADYGIARARLVGRAPEPKRLMFLHGTTWASKHWPENYWCELARLAIAEGFSVQLPWGNANERERAERIAVTAPDQMTVLPKLTLRGIAEALAACRGAVAVDTGLGHLAAALAIPTVSLYGPTDPTLTRAYGESQHHLAADFPCAPCLSKDCRYTGESEEKPACFTRLPPALVWDQLKRHLAMSEEFVLAAPSGGPGIDAGEGGCGDIA